MRFHWIEMGTLASLLLIAGCSQSANENYKEAGKAAETATQKLGQGLKESAKEAEAKVKPQLESAKTLSANALMTGKIKQALLAAEGLDASHIDVTSEDGTVHLKGSVPSAAQYAQASSLARNIANGAYKISNELTVQK